MKKKKTTRARRAPVSKRSVRPRTAKSRKASTAAPEPKRWNLRLYVAGQTPRSLAAFANLQRMCEERLAGMYTIEVIDVARRPELAQADQIVALPTLVRKLPEPIRRVIGDLSNLKRVMVAIELEPSEDNA